MAIPSVVGMENARSLIRDGELLIVDGDAWRRHHQPGSTCAGGVPAPQNQIALENSKLKRLKTAKSQTIDGVDVQLFANIELPSMCRLR
jgi:phosphotransferase system enzyme I (PtsI)